jgi:GR25 family glycosyltransferase involved in LPS biosynthesis
MKIAESRSYEKPGPRACAAAHRLAWREARRCGSSSVLIFEDDVVLANGFRQKLETWLAAVPDDWQILYLGGVFLDPPELIAPEVLRVSGRTLDMHAYAVRTQAISALSRVVAPLSWRSKGTVESRTETIGHSILGEKRALDTAIPVLHASLPTYAPWPPLAWQTMGLSNNEIARRGNYRADGQQDIWREAVAHLP